MDLDVLDGLSFIQYPLDEASLKKAVEEWPVSVEYTKLVEWLTKELQHFCKLDEHVNAITTSDDSNSFMLELSSFLKELGCPYKKLTQGNVKERLKTSNDRYILLDFLITEVLAARITSVNKPSENNMELRLNESDTAASLRKMLMALSFPKPPTNITAQMLFAKVQNKVKELSDKCISDPLFSGLLSPKQWAILAQLQDELREEYRVRRQMLLKRLDVTIQSFQWSERMKGRENDIARLYLDRRRALVDEPSMKLSDLLAARAHLAVLEKTSNANVRKNTQSPLNKVIIGRVPDRGGRPQDQQPPPPEMPSWAPRTNQPQGGFGGGGGRGRGGDRGGRVQGGWNSGGDNYQGGRGHQENYQGGGGRGHQDNYQGGGGRGHQDNYQGGGGRGHQDNYQGGGGRGHQDNYQGGGGRGHQENYQGGGGRGHQDNYQGGGGRGHQDNYQGGGGRGHQDNYHGGGGRGHQENYHGGGGRGHQDNYHGGGGRVHQDNYHGGSGGYYQGGGYQGGRGRGGRGRDRY